MKNKTKYTPEITRHYLNGAWNGIYNDAINMKLYKLPIPKPLEDKAYTIIGTEGLAYELWENINYLTKEFTDKTGLGITWEGRQGAYLTICNKDYYFREVKTTHRERQELIKLAKKIFTTLLYHCTRDIEEIEIQYTKKELVFTN